MSTYLNLIGGSNMLKNMMCIWIVSSMFVALATLSGCGGAGSAYDQAEVSEESEGKLMLSITDAEGDFLSYTVDVTSIKLKKAGGAIIEVVPEQTRIDFAQYVEMTEFFTAVTIPSGIYTSIEMTLDYQNAGIQVEGANGDPVKAIVTDSEGTQIDTTEITVDLGENGLLRVFPGLPSFITLDFDLESSHVLDMETSPVTAELDPVVIADTILEDPKPHLVRGALAKVNTDDNFFAVDLRPFRFKQGRFGTAFVTTDEETHYEIDGETYFGDEGLEALSLLDAKTAVLVTGDISISQRQYMASHVVAGSSLPWGEKDIVTGNVIARDGNTATIRGATLVRASGAVIFRNNVDVILADATKVTQVGSGEVSADAISVGQRLSVYGDISVESEEYTLLDATDGGARLHITSLCGTVVSLEPLTVNLQAINGRPSSVYDFTGTGSATANDSNPDFYEINTENLSLSGVSIGDPVRIRGFAQPFGQAPEDFDATTIIDVSSVVSRVMIRWDQPGADTSLTISDDELTVDTESEELGLIHHIRRAGINTDIALAGETMTIVPRTEKTGLFVIKLPHKTLVFYRYDNYETALQAAIDSSLTIKQIRAAGRYDDDENRLVATAISTIVN